MSEYTFDIRPLNESDYDDILLKWWADWKWTAPVRDFLPDNGKGGIIVYDEEVPVCAGFLYVTNSKVAWVDWIISNKEYRKKPHRKQALTLLIDTLTNICRQTGNKYSYALLKHSSLIETYEKIGYVKGGENVNEMIKAL